MDSSAGGAQRGDVVAVGGDAVDAHEPHAGQGDGRGHVDGELVGGQAGRWAVPADDEGGAARRDGEGA